ncbi:hypothetical protein D3C77_722770 [compost metagenome]
MGAIVNHPEVNRATSRKVRNPAIFGRKFGVDLGGARLTDSGRTRKAPPPKSPHPADSAFAFLSINFHLAFKKHSFFLRRYILGSGVPEF